VHALAPELPVLKFLNQATEERVMSHINHNREDAMSTTTYTKADYEARVAAERADSMAQVVNEFGETRGELDKLFGLVKPADHWKGAIDAWVDGLTDLVALERAIIFFTGSVPTFAAGIGRVHVRAGGYWAAVGS